MRPPFKHDLEQYILQFERDGVQHWYDKESKYQPPANYLDSRQDITPEERTALIKLVHKVHTRFKGDMDTLLLAVNIIDRYIAHIEKVSNPTLIGLTALLIAAKQEEIYPLECSDLVYISHMYADESITREELLKMEFMMLEALNYDLLVPYPIFFLWYTKIGYGTKMHSISNYFIELSLTEYSTLKYPPSMIASAASVIALIVCGDSDWDSALDSKYSKSEITTCVNDLLAIANTLDDKSTVKIKYSTKKEFHVSLVCFPRGLEQAKHI